MVRKLKERMNIRRVENIGGGRKGGRSWYEVSKTECHAVQVLCGEQFQGWNLDYRFSSENEEEKSWKTE